MARPCAQPHSWQQIFSRFRDLFPRRNRAGESVNTPRAGRRPTACTTGGHPLQVGHDAVRDPGISVGGGRARHRARAWLAVDLLGHVQFSLVTGGVRGLAMTPARRRDRGSRGGMRAGVAGLRASGSRCDLRSRAALPPCPFLGGRRSQHICVQREQQHVPTRASIAGWCAGLRDLLHMMTEGSRV